MTTCEKCEKPLVQVVEVEGQAVARSCGCVCSACAGSGYTRAVVVRGNRSYSALADCTLCPGRLERLRCFNKAGLPAVLGGATLDSFVPTHPQQEKAREVARAFVESGGVGPGFLVTGPVGTGKTHLLVATLRHLALERGVHVRYVEMSFLYATIRRGFQEGRSGGEIIGPLAEVPVLAVDELGKGRGTPFEMDTLDELIARRYNARRPTLFSSNYPLKDESPPPPTKKGLTVGSLTLVPAGAAEETLLARVGSRTYSRLHEMCTLVAFPAKELSDQRMKVDHQG